MALVLMLGGYSDAIEIGSIAGLLPGTRFSAANTNLNGNHSYRVLDRGLAALIRFAQSK
jgi:hypothetical protein